MSLHEIIVRSLELDDLVVERSSEGRTIVARALTYGVPYEVSDDGGRSFYHEVWRSGVFDKSLRERSGKIPLYVTHDRAALPYGHLVAVEPDASAFIFRAKINNGPRGDEALELIHDDVLTGISVGARPLNNRAIAGGVERVEAKLAEISLTPFAQMADGKVLAVRALIPDPEPVVTPTLDQARAFLSNLTRP